MVVDVTHVVEALPRLSAVDRLGRAHAAEVDDIRVARIDANLAEIHRALILVRHEVPRASLVIGSPHAGHLWIRRRSRTTAPTPSSTSPAKSTFPTGRLPPGDYVRPLFLVLRDFDLRVDHVRVRARDVERDAAHGAARQTIPGDSLPRLSTVCALIEAASCPAATEAPRRALTLIHRRPEVRRIARIDDELSRSGVLIDVERLVPR